jgi:hypothetical protein
MSEELREDVLPIEKRMMNLTLHVQKEKEVELVMEKTGLVLERSPQGVFVGRGEEGLMTAASEVIAKLKRDGYKHVLVGGSTGLVAKIVKYTTENDMDVSLYEFENSKERDGSGKPVFKPVNIRKVI